MALSSQNISNAFGAVFNVNSNSNSTSSSSEEARANEEIVKAYEATIDNSFQAKAEVTPNVLGLVRPNIGGIREIIRPVFTVSKKRITAVGVGETKVIAHNKAIAKFFKVAN